ncbi:MULTISPECIES: amino acid ABC transporter permease [unclassified Bacillus (in: firmicutes)]|uniref:amino acid ABC transporter permease n=1 Tax=unclassified Bacillus (in: firmicutes) TaxID=185979 RepID=UPI001BEA49C7|nr:MULTISPECIES: amino acid ABC transporter permease [unclassified Bacillus (in: firmicutes)]MBT2617694.1 amino acid ABC transporter permease [Bacillus sp. ISL-78]MBT2631753.1 amino acid ABC transporter permease [Bacillus sp. ISL-101]
MNFDLQYMLEISLQIAKFIPITLVLAIISMALAIIIGLVVALIRNSNFFGITHLAGLYISLFRGMPTLVQLFIIYYGLPQLFPSLSTMEAMTAAIIGFSLKESSYLAEIFRAGLNSVDKGQMEAGLATGMKRVQIYSRIILPQAALNALPATGNTFISLIKETSLAFTLGITELFAEGKIIASANMRFFETYLVVGLIYWLLVILYSWIQKYLEIWLSKPLRR